MSRLIPLAVLGLLLSGCPDSSKKTAETDKTGESKTGKQTGPRSWKDKLQPKGDAWKKHEQVLRFNNGTEPETLDMHLATGVPENRLGTALFEGLVGLHPETLDPIPGVAESWTISKDGLTYTFKLRKNAKWSDGRGITAKDFYDSWKRALTPATGCQYGQMFYPIKGAEYHYRGLFSPLNKHKQTDSNEEGLSPKLIDALEASDIRFLGEVVQKTADELTKLEGIGDLQVKELKRFLGKRGMTQGRKLSGFPKRSVLEKIEKGELDAFSQVGAAYDEKDPYTFVVTLHAPCAYFFDMVAFKTLFPVPMWVVNEKKDKWSRPENIVCNGPFKLAEWKPNERIVMVPNEHYWDAKIVKLQKVVAFPYEDTETAFKLFKQGKIDWNTTIPLDKVDEVKDMPEYDGLAYLGCYYYRFNTTKPPFDKFEVRKALSIGFDRSIITRDILKTGEQPATSYCPQLRGYKPPKGFGYNREEAKQLLAKAGYPDGKGFPTVTLLYNTSEAHKKVAEAIVQQWKENLGITVSLRNTEWKVYLNEVEQLNYQIARAGWIGDYVDPNTFLNMFVTGGGNNNTGWSNKEYDDLIDKCTREVDTQKRYAYFKRAETILVREGLPIMPIYYYVNKVLKRPKVRGWYENILDHHPFQFIWIEPIE